MVSCTCEWVATSLPTTAAAVSGTTDTGDDATGVTSGVSANNASHIDSNRDQSSCTPTLAELISSGSGSSSSADSTVLNRDGAPAPVWSMPTGVNPRRALAVVHASCTKDRAMLPASSSADRAVRETEGAKTLWVPAADA